jgi:uncharacterized metal-binding protein YceD (DUF177 family)
LTHEFYITILRPRWCPRRRDQSCYGNGVAIPVSVTPEVGEIALTDTRAMPEFSRLVQVDIVDTDGAALTLRANEDECAAVAGRLDLQSVADLRAEVSMRRTAVGLVRLNVDFSANVVQSCVVTLEAVAATVADRFSVLCDGAQKRGKKGSDAEEEVFVDPFGEDPVEPLVDGCIDLGELVTQHLSLSLDPYPHAPGIEADGVMDNAAGSRPDVSLDLAVDDADADAADAKAALGPDTGAETANPFAVLQHMRTSGRAGG